MPQINSSTQSAQIHIFTPVEEGDLNDAITGNREFQNDPPIILETNSLEIYELIAQIEGNSAKIDSHLELYMLVQYGGLRARLTSRARAIVDQLLPTGRAGHLKLAAAWLERRFNGGIMPDSCNRALAFISGRSHISVAALRSHYQQTMRSRLIAAARDKFNFPAGTSDQAVINTVIDLYSYVATFDGRGNLRVNDQALFNNLVKSIRECRSRNTPDYVAYMATVDTVSNDLGRRIDNSISGSSVSMMSPLNNNGRIVAQEINAGR